MNPAKPSGRPPSLQSLRLPLYTEGRTDDWGAELYYVEAEEVDRVGGPARRLALFTRLCDAGFIRISFDPFRYRYQLVLQRAPDPALPSPTSTAR